VNPLELTDYLVAGATLLIGLGVGRRIRPKPPEPFRPMCACGHNFGSHRDGASCAAETERAHYLRGGSRNGKEWVACPCLRYDGPDPAIFGLEHRP
jgi:hypothetical protein